MPSIHSVFISIFAFVLFSGSQLSISYWPMSKIWWSFQRWTLPTNPISYDIFSAFRFLLLFLHYSNLGKASLPIYITFSINAIQSVAITSRYNNKCRTSNGQEYMNCDHLQSHLICSNHSSFFNTPKIAYSAYIYSCSLSVSTTVPLSLPISCPLPLSNNG